MYVFGGCTATWTTFNDLWQLDLGTRTWVRPITMGSYPSPKACATMLYYKNSLILFGGWSHPSPYPLHQVTIQQEGDQRQLRYCIYMLYVYIKYHKVL